MKSTEDAAPSGLTVETPAWKKGLVLLCSKCSGQQHGQPGPKTAPSWDTWELRCWLKKRLTEEDLWGEVRVVTTSCLGICRDGKVTCSLGGDASGDGQCMVVDPAQDAEELLAVIRRSVAV